jgi:hypothetical protein
LHLWPRSEDYPGMRWWTLMAGSLLLVLLTSAPAHADATIFLGITTTPARRLARGFAAGASLIILGFEFEYAATAEDPAEAAPSLKTGMGNAYVQTPFGAIQFYALLGGGLYRERIENQQETSTATALGGGAKVALAGPLRLRLDYRLFKLGGTPRYTQVHRVYAGLNLMF